MPFIHVRLFEGRSIEQKRAFAEALTQDAVTHLKCKPEAVDIVFDDVKKSDWASAGRLASDPPKD
jgi:4-oxalocrotonate tautomerase